MVAPKQPWLDGYVVENGLIRQFVAMPLGAGYSAEEQLTGHADHGGLQLAVYPMKRVVFDALFRKPVRLGPRPLAYLGVSGRESFSGEAAPDMGLAPGGRMKQDNRRS